MRLKLISCLLIVSSFCLVTPKNLIPEKKPTFQRSNVEQYPDLGGIKANLEDFSSRTDYDSETFFSRSAVESLPAVKVSQYLPLRAAVQQRPDIYSSDAKNVDEWPERHVDRFMDRPAMIRVKYPVSLHDEDMLENYQQTTKFDSSARYPPPYRAESPFQQLVNIKDLDVLPLQRFRPAVDVSNRLVKNPKTKGLKVICHITNWSFYRKNDGKFVPENLETDLCTHIIYSFATLNPETLTLKEFDPWGDIENGLYKRVTSLDPNVPVLLGLGGWTDSHGDKYSRLIEDPKNRKKFIDQVIPFLKQYGFKGLHVDWNYPICWQSNCKSGPDTDKPNFTKFIQELKKEFSKHDMLVGTSISGYIEIISKAYELNKLTEAADFLTIMTYDYHGSWESVTGHVSPLYGDSKDKYPQYNVDFAMQALVKNGAKKEKLIVGVPFYGQTFTLAQSREDIAQGFGSPSNGPGEAGEFTSQPGMLAYNEICQRIKNKKWRTGKDSTGRSGPYATNWNQWVGYDDVSAITVKSKYVIDNGYGGIAAWTVDLDDMQNLCCSETFPLLKAINRAFGRISTKVPTVSNCQKPAAPVTPTPPVMTTTTDLGLGGVPITASTGSHQHTTYPSWSSEETKPSTWWSPSSTTTMKPVTKITTTKMPTVSTTTTKSTTKMSSTKKSTKRPTTTTESPVTEEESENDMSTIIPSPVNHMPVMTEGKCDEGKFKSHETICNAYYVCVNSAWSQQFCGGGTHWAGSHCDWPSAVNCTKENGGYPQPTQSSGQRTTTVKTTVSSSKRPMTSSQAPVVLMEEDYHTTTRKSSTKKPSKKPSKQPATTTEIPDSTTMQPTTQYVTTKKPKPSKSPKPSKKPTTQTKCTNGEYYPHKSCEKFFICINGRKLVQECEKGWQYSQTTKSCDLKEKVRCISKKEYERLVNEGSDSKSRMVEDEEEDEDDEDIEYNINDTCNEGQFVEHPTSCNEFLVCDHYHFISMKCRDDLHWNAEMMTCDWPESAGCAEEIESGEETGDNNEYHEIESPNHVQQPVETQNSEETDENEVEDSHQMPTTTTKKPTTTTRKTTTRKPMSTSKKPPVTTKMPHHTESVTQGPIPIIYPDVVKPLKGPFKLVCYFTNWAWYRQGLAKYTPDQIDSNLCTHIVYGFAVLDYSELTIKTHDGWADIDNRFYERVVELKSKGIKVTLAIGGWNDSEGDKYSRLVRSPSARAKFIRHVIEFIEKHGFEGLDLDWEYPVCWQVDCKKGFAEEKAGFAALVKELSDKFKPKGLLLSAAVSPSKTVIDAGYDVPILAKYFDWIAVMTYDFHGQWDKKTGHLAPLYEHPDDEFDYFNSDYAIRYWIEKGTPKQKIVMGMPLYGQAFTLADSKNHGLNAKAPGPGTAGEFTRAAGFLAYYEICERILNRGWTVVRDPKRRMGPYAYKDNQWVSFDDQEMLRLKAKYIKDMGLGGGMIWALDLDDFNARCGQGKHPLLKTIHHELGSTSSGQPYVPENSSSDEMTSAEISEGSDTGEEMEIEEETAQEPENSQTVVDENEPESSQELEDSSENQIDDEDEEYKVICYFTNWAWYRQGLGKYVPEDIDPELCTHIVYGFAVLNRDTLTIKPHDSWADIDNNFYSRVVEFKKKGIKVTVAIGGWNDSAGDKYSKLVRNPAARARFITNVVEFIEQWNFDGLDLDWEYPVCWQVDCKKGYADEKENFAEFVKELSDVLKPKGLLLSSAVSPSKQVIDAGYDIPTLSDHFDWIAVMAYDYHGQWDKKTGHVAPMYEHPDDFEKTFNANFSINYWISEGADPKKIIMGMPMYGQSFSLAETTTNGLNTPTYGGGEAGEGTRARGFLSYYEICERIQKKGWKVVRDPKGRMGPYAYLRDQWVSFDDAPMIKHKSEFVRAMGLGGAMIWALDLDDFTNICGCEEYPLLRTINRVLRKYPGPHKNCKLEESISHGTPDVTRKPIAPMQTSKNPSYQPTTSKKPIYKPTSNKKPEYYPTTQSTKFKKPSTESVVIDDNEPERGCSSGTLYFPHENNCNMYYQCMFGKPVAKECGPGLHWKDDHCEWAYNSDCKNKKPSEMENSEENEEEPEDYEEPEEIDEIPSQKPSKSTTKKPQTTKRPTKKPTTTMAPTKKPTTQRPEIPDDPVILTNNNEYKMVCYFTNWAWYRPGEGKYTPDHIDESLCTHIVYGFAVLNRDTLTIKTHDGWADLDNRFYERVAALKHKGVKVSLALGGWNDSLGNKYSRLVRDAAARARFVKHAVEFVEKYGFEGLDLDWEYPVCWQVDCDMGEPDEKEHFADLVQELSEVFRPRGLLLSVAVSPSKKVIDAGYDIPRLSKYFDWIAVMCYDYHGHWDKQTGHLAPLYHHPDVAIDYFNANFSMNYWIEKGAPRKTLVMGMPMYGQAFTINDPKAGTALNAKATKGTAGKYTRAAGFLAYYEICAKVNNEDWTVVRDEEGRIGPYAYKGNQWVSYDDVEDIRRKTKYIKDMGLGGGMIWALDLDDFRGNSCGCGKHPLLRALNLELGRIETAKISDCT